MPRVEYSWPEKGKTSDTGAAGITPNGTINGTILVERSI
jgi:hypothetical protein